MGTEEPMRIYIQKYIKFEESNLQIRKTPSVRVTLNNICEKNAKL